LGELIRMTDADAMGSMGLRIKEHIPMQKRLRDTLSLAGGRRRVEALLMQK